MNLRAELAKFQNWRRNGITTEKEGMRYDQEHEKLQKVSLFNFIVSVTFFLLK